MDTLRDKRLLEDAVAAGSCAMERVDMTTGFWRDRPTFVTGATGLVGGWLVKRLVAAGADVVCLVRDWVPQSVLVCDRLWDRVRVVRGDVTDQPLLERALGEYEIDTVIHLAAQTIVGIANRNPISTLEIEHRRHLANARGVPPQPAVRQIVLASSDKAYGDQPELPYDESTPLQGEHPYDVSKSCADLIARMYAVTYELPVAITRCGNFFGGGDLNWNRIVPGTIRSIVRGREAGDPVRRKIRPRLFLRRGRRRGLHAAGRTAGCRPDAGR